MYRNEQLLYWRLMKLAKLRQRRASLEMLRRARRWDTPGCGGGSRLRGGS